jgi:TonB dependent receptor-like, beta-barrel/Carboxypeptidase regulatory-like domain
LRFPRRRSFELSFRRLWVAAALLAAMTLPAAAQQAVRGQVRDAASQQPIAGARIELRNAAGKSSEQTVSDSSGRFAILNVAAGEIEAEVSAAQYSSERWAITLAPRQTVDLDVLLRSKVAETVTVEVSAGAGYLDPGRAQTSVILGQNEVAEMPAAYTTSIPKLVAQYVPGAIQSHDNFVHLKGNELSLHQFEDGVGFLDNTQSHFSPGLSPETIESVNIITGGMPAEFGNRLGGVLDISIKSGRSMSGGQVSLGGGTIVDRNAAFEYGLAHDKWDAYVFASGFSDGRYLNPSQHREIHDLAYGSRNIVKLGYLPGERDRVTLMVSAAGVNPQLPVTTGEWEIGRDPLRRLRAQSDVLRWQRTLSPTSLFTATYYQRYSTDRLVGTSDPVTPYGQAFRRTLTNGAKADWMTYKGGHDIKAGVDVAVFSLNEDMTFDPRPEFEEPAAEAVRGNLLFGGGFPAAAFSPFALIDGGPPRVGHEAQLPEFVFRGRRRGGDGSIYVQDRFSPFPNFTVHAGVRYDRYSVVVSEGLVSPRLGLSYHVAPIGMVLRAVYNRYFVPAPLEYVQLGSALGSGAFDEHHDEEAAEEPGGEGSEGGEEHEEVFPGPVRGLRQHYFEIGFQQPLHRKITLDVSSYHHQGRNAYENAELSNTRLFIPTNYDRERTWGTDVSLRVRPLDRVGLFGYLNYSNMTTRFIGPVSGGLFSDEAGPGETVIPAFDQRNTASASLSYRHDKSGFLAGFGVSYGSGTPAELPSDQVGGAEALSFAALGIGGAGRVAQQSEEEDLTLVRLPAWWTFDIWAGAPVWKTEHQSLELQFNLQNVGDRVVEIAKESEETPIQFGGRRRVSLRMQFRF